jgi:hypothetical protein
MHCETTVSFLVFLFTFVFAKFAKYNKSDHTSNSSTNTIRKKRERNNGGESRP